MPLTVILHFPEHFYLPVSRFPAQWQATYRLGVGVLLHSGLHGCIAENARVFIAVLSSFGSPPKTSYREHAM